MCLCALSSSCSLKSSNPASLANLLKSLKLSSFMSAWLNVFVVESALAFAEVVFSASLCELGKSVLRLAMLYLFQVLSIPSFASVR